MRPSALSFVERVDNPLYVFVVLGKDDGPGLAGGVVYAPNVLGDDILWQVVRAEPAELSDFGVER